MPASRTGECWARSSSYERGRPRQNPKSPFVVTDPSEILEALVGLKEVRVLHYRRHGPEVELMIEQVVDEVRCPSCGGIAQVKERPVVSYVDLPVYGAAMRLCWKKHRMVCVEDSCPKKSWVLTEGSPVDSATSGGLERGKLP